MPFATPGSCIRWRFVATTFRALVERKTFSSARKRSFSARNSRRSGASDKFDDVLIDASEADRRHRQAARLATAETRLIDGDGARQAADRPAPPRADRPITPSAHQAGLLDALCNQHDRGYSLVMVVRAQLRAELRDRLITEHIARCHACWQKRSNNCVSTSKPIKAFRG